MKFVLAERWRRGKMKSGHTQREEDALSLNGRRDEGVISLDAETLHSKSGEKTKVKKRADFDKHVIIMCTSIDQSKLTIKLD